MIRAILLLCLWTMPSSSIAANQKFLRRGDREGRELKAHKCKAIAVFADTEESLPDTKELYCETDDGMMHELKGTRIREHQLEKWMEDGTLVSGETDLVLPRDFDEMLNEDGDLVLKEGEEVSLDNARRLYAIGSSSPEEQQQYHERQRHLKTSGTKSVLVVRVEATDGETTASAEELEKAVFANGPNDVTLASQYNKCSNGVLKMVPASDRPVTGTKHPGSTGIKNGVTTIKFDLPVGAGDAAFRGAVGHAINANFGVTHPNQIAHHVLVCLPPGAMMGGRLAYAVVNGWNSIYRDGWCLYNSGQMHEVGHNLGLGHANEGGSYLDNTGMMGYSFTTPTWMCFNGAQYWILGWLRSGGNPHAAATFTPIRDTSALYELQAMTAQNWWEPNHPIVVKIETTSTLDFYVSFNLAKEFNSGTKEAQNQITVVEAGANGAGYTHTQLRAKLGEGQYWEKVGVDGKTVRVYVHSINSANRNSEAVVCVTVDGASCAMATTAPQPTKSPVSPTRAPTKPPTKAPTPAPTKAPTKPPTKAPTKPPTKAPTKSPTPAPTKPPTKSPVFGPPPSHSPTPAPTPAPTPQPTPSPNSQNAICTDQTLTSVSELDGNLDFIDFENSGLVSKQKIEDAFAPLVTFGRRPGSGSAPVAHRIRNQGQGLYARNFEKNRNIRGTMVLTFDKPVNTVGFLYRTKADVNVGLFPNTHNFSNQIGYTRTVTASDGWRFYGLKSAVPFRRIEISPHKRGRGARLNINLDDISFGYSPCIAYTNTTEGTP